MKVGTKVWCYRNCDLPLVEGTVIENEPRIPSNYQYIHWDIGGVSYFPLNHIFTTYEDWKKFHEKMVVVETDRKIQEEYDLYLKLREKFKDGRPHAYRHLIGHEVSVTYRGYRNGIRTLIGILQEACEDRLCLDVHQVYYSELIDIVDLGESDV